MRKRRLERWRILLLPLWALVFLMIPDGLVTWAFYQATLQPWFLEVGTSGPGPYVFGLLFIICKAVGMVAGFVTGVYVTSRFLTPAELLQEFVGSREIRVWTPLMRRLLRVIQYGKRTE